MTATPATLVTASEVRCERVLDAPIARVWAACTQPDLMAGWFCPNPEWTCVVENDLRVGGPYTVRMGEHVASGEYVEIDEPAKVAFTWSWVGQEGPTTRVTIELSEDGQGTRLVLTHAGMTGEEDAANHAQGWDGCLVRLPSVIAG